MKPLDGHRVAALGSMAGRPLARYLETMGAHIVPLMLDHIEELAAASFLIDDLGLERLADAGWSREAIKTANPEIIHASVTAFGSGGPRSLWVGGELVASAMGGTLRLTGTPDRAPVKEARDACTFHAEMMAATGICAAHYARGGGAGGQHVDVSIQEVAFNRNVNSTLVWHFDKRKLHRVGGALNYGRATVKCIWKLADGWCFHSLMTGRFGAPANQGLSDWIDDTGLPNPLAGVDWLSYNRSTLDPAIRSEWEGAMAAFFATRTKADIATEGKRRGINACVVNEPGDLLADTHLAAREFWKDENNVREPARFVSFSDGTAAEKRSSNNGDRPGPLAGVRILDFSWALVGSITTKTLGDLGAEVIKIESRTRPCLSRLDVQVSASQAGNFDDKPWFAHLNTSKKSLALDMKRPEAWELLDPLIQWADVVVENFSPGTMAKLGLDYDSLTKRNPGIIMLSGSVYGQTGPMAQEWGVDGTGGALSGRTYLTGWADRDPVIPGAVPYGDVIVPPVMAAAVSAALQHRRETGQGCHIDAAMYEVCAQQMRDAIVETQTSAKPERLGNADPDVSLQDVYPAKGDDRWVAISVADDAQLKELHSIAGPDIAAWTASQSDSAAVAILQAAGIAAGVVQDIEDLMADVQLSQRGALVTLDHPHLGAFGHMRTPISLYEGRVVPFRAPSIGEHNHEVATMAGINDTRYAELDALGVFK